MKEPLLEKDSYGETVKTWTKKGRKRTLFGVTGCSLNKKVKSICLLNRELQFGRLLLTWRLPWADRRRQSGLRPSQRVLLLQAPAFSNKPAWLTCTSPFFLLPLCLALFPSSLLPFSKSLPVTEESWQNGRKRAQTGQGRMWCQRPQTIKGAKVLPSLNCSSSVKWEPKLSTSFSEQSRLVCSTPHIRALGWRR